MIVFIVEVVITCISLYGFISQLVLLRREKNIGSFSIYFPHIILSNCILKIFFWIIKPFALGILIQCLLLIIVSLLVLQECVKLREKNVTFKDGYFSNAFSWKSFKQHVLFIVSFSLLLAGITFISVSYQIPAIGDGFAYLATLIQISQCLPQLIASYKTKSVAGVSQTMIAIWVVSDSLKTVYFIFNNQPIQFILTGSILIVFDLALVAQIILYRENDVKKLQ